MPFYVPTSKCGKYVNEDLNKTYCEEVLKEFSEDN